MYIFLIAVFGTVFAYAGILGLRDGETCTPREGGPGSCRLLSKCATVGDFKNNHPPICSFRGKDWEPIICCPTEEQSLTVVAGSKVKKICDDLETILPNITYAWAMIKLDGFEPPKKVVPNEIVGDAGFGGSPVPAKKHPYMALIGFCGTENKSCDSTEVVWGCGASLITPWFVLSAAHCAHQYSLGPARWARLGDLDISTSEEDSMPVNVSIIEIIVHPQYTDTQVYHDIALFRLKEKVWFNGYVLPICLNTERWIEQKKANFTGWGRTAFDEGTSEKLLEGEMDVYNDTECKRLMFDTYSPKTPLGHQPELMLCAGLPDGSRDACPGDSGGPLVAGGGSKYRFVKTQIGITSYGRMCGLPDSPGVYTRVSNYIPWIEEVAFNDVTVD